MNPEPARAELRSLEDLGKALDGIVGVRGNELEIQDETGFRGDLIDRLVYTAVFGEGDLQAAARWLIGVAAPKLGAFPASIHELYMAAGRGLYSNATAPAINVRGMTYDIAQTIFRAAKANDTKIVLFEIARSEMGYTNQRPGEYASAVLAAAIKNGHQGPVFIQGDHFQANAKNYAKDPAAEIKSVRDLAIEAIGSGFYNIDIDASTLVDIDLPTLAEQQRNNYVHTAELTAVIRDHEPKGITVSVGGEIGEVGRQNSTVEDLTAFMDGYLPELERLSGEAGRKLHGISKISVQTGTSHGGIPLPDGTIKQVSVDFDTLGALSKAAREQYHLGGAVQHGASTLPEEYFDRFAQANAIEVHLATAFQNQLFDSPNFPDDLRQRMYEHLAANHADERKPDQTDTQFYYTTRKRAFGPFKREMWDLPAATRESLMAELQETYSLVMRRLGVAGSAALVDEQIKPVAVEVQAPEALQSLTTV
jgi:fructose/tagatose bisphosphate aldolase